MTITALLMMVIRFLFEAREREALRSILVRQPACALPHLELSRNPPYPILAPPIDRLPRWVTVLVMGAGASIGSQIVSGLIWMAEAAITGGESTALKFPCPKRTLPLLLDPICGHPHDFLLRFTTENSPSYLGTNALAFFFVVYVLLPRRAQGNGFGLRSIALVFDRIFRKTAADMPSRARRAVPRYRRWVAAGEDDPARVVAQPAPAAAVNGVPCAANHWTSGSSDRAGESEFLCGGTACLQAHAHAAHEQIYVVGGEAERLLVVLESVLRGLAARIDEASEWPRLPKISILAQAGARMRLTDLARSLGASLESYQGDPRRLVVTIDPALSCGATYFAHAEEHAERVGASTTFSVILHEEGGRAARIHDAIELLAEECRDTAPRFSDGSAIDLDPERANGAAPVAEAGARHASGVVSAPAAETHPRTGANAQAG